jgi:hypothetical protein
VYVEDHLTSTRGTERVLETPFLEPGKAYRYRLRAAFRSGANLLIQEQVAWVQAGRETAVRFDGVGALAIPLTPSDNPPSDDRLPAPRKITTDK